MIRNKQACFCPLGFPLIFLSDPPSLRALWLEKSVAIRVFSAAEPVSKRKRSLMTYCQNNCVRVCCECLRLSSFFLSSDLWILEAAYSTGGVACKVWREKAKARNARKGGGKSVANFEF